MTPPMTQTGSQAKVLASGVGAASVGISGLFIGEQIYRIYVLCHFAVTQGEDPAVTHGERRAGGTPIGSRPLSSIDGG
jgi:hypothetical protein